MSGLARSRRHHVVIVGGGVTGAAVAWHLASRPATRELAITVIEPRDALGGGLAYSTQEPSHRVNVPASRMSLLPDDPAHFSRWLAASGETSRDPDAVWDNGDIYPRRSVFGRYVAAQLQPFLDSGRIVHERAFATRVARSPEGWLIDTSAGNQVTASVVVLAASHPPPGIPAALSAIGDSAGFIANPYAPGTLADIDSSATILIVGTGLTSADVVAELDRRGHNGRIVALSRHGLGSRSHPRIRAEPFGDFLSAPASTALGLLKCVRETVGRADRSGLSWHAVFDRLRADGPAIWAALVPDERARLVARLRVFWDVHRFRIAPQVAVILERKAAAGTFRTVAASLLDARPESGRLAVRFRHRGRKAVDTLRADVVVNTTGPAHRSILLCNPALRSLADDGRIRADRYGLGIDTSRDSRAVTTTGDVTATLFVAGPLARGTFGELMGLPEVARHAQTVAADVGREMDAVGSLPGIVTGDAA